ncbi:putative asparaginase like 1 [Boeremia exigua]|uniref:putative asparaginase like 1 n=1 Tax=Boeremia exigua TaxID=749465 RepID=UPI001E8C9F4D|nr:putative asparaginase like 1 [Boeremia exigua]KAH6616858.1 putative asparaginase like 1 [Boeremia exigua]
MLTVHPIDSLLRLPPSGPNPLYTYEESDKRLTSLHLERKEYHARKPKIEKSASTSISDAKKREGAPKLWKTPSTFAMSALHSPWYTAMLRLQSTLIHTSVDFFNQCMGYRYVIVPMTTGSISSPMGLGSDSQPVSIELAGTRTYLADSQQFTLEYALRLEDGLKGAYYLGTSCRGEDPDATHLNQFCHVECELLGELEDGMRVANEYVIALVQAFKKNHRIEVERIAGTTKHLDDMLDLYQAHGNAFPMITLDDALALPEMTENMWYYAVEGRPQYGRCLSRVGEQMLIAKFGGAVWLTEMDHMSVPFYQAYAGDNRKARCGDLLIGMGEVVGCGNRHETAEQALDALERHEVDPAEYDWYVEMRKVKELNTTGWGIGSERFLAWILQHDDIRDIQLLPRLKGMLCAP